MSFYAQNDTFMKYGIVVFNNSSFWADDFSKTNKQTNKKRQFKTIIIAI